MLAKKSPKLVDAIERIKQLNLTPRDIERSVLRSMAEASYKAEFKRARAEGLAEGERENALEVATKLLRAQSTLKFVAKISGLSLDEVRVLKAQISAEQKT
ncbi:MAG: hypothetical protein LBO66_09255 [Deltaproteobacteria bacterium]|jgi:predicted transposase YdaD|nr:hypothetical protein [Deltaproteobacteria bacterium]